MSDAEVVAFLQWTLPRLGLRWVGFRRVRRQVHKRIARRVRELGLPDLAAYRDRLRDDPGEWAELDRRCRITISRFHRDRDVMGRVIERVLPGLAAAALARGERALRVLCAGCAAGEEPYTLAIAWRLELGPRFAPLALRVVATDADAGQLARAERAVYPASSLRELPDAWRAAAFAPHPDGHVLRPAFREGVRFSCADVRREHPDGPFDLVLCRNLGFTYFDEPAQRALAAAIRERTRPGGALVLGRHEELPAATPGWRAEDPGRRIYRAVDDDPRSEPMETTT